MVEEISEEDWVKKNQKNQYIVFNTRQSIFLPTYMTVYYFIFT